MRTLVGQVKKDFQTFVLKMISKNKIQIKVIKVIKGDFFQQVTIH